MPTLESARGKDFLPDFAAAFDKTVLGFEREEEKRKAAELKSEARLQGEILADPDFSEADKKEAGIRLALLDPQASKAVNDMLKSGNELEIGKASQIAERGLKNATFVQKQKTFNGKLDAWREVIAGKIQRGAGQAEIDEDMKTLNLPEDEFNLRMEKMVTAGTDIKTLTTPAKPVSVGKGASLVDPTTGETIFQSPTEAGGVDFAKPAVKDFTPESVVAASKKGGAVDDLVLRPEALAKLGGGDAFKIGREVKIRVGDKEFFVTPVTQRDKAGNVVTVGNLTPIVGPDEAKKVDFISPLGETGGEKTKRAVEEAGQKTRAERLALIETQADLTGVQKRTEKDFVFMDSALDAARNIPTLNQTLALLQKIETGGIDAGILATARAFGVESGNQAELTFNLRKNVLKQLKPTFGAAFTEREGKLLSEIEASEKKSTAGNIRLIKRAIRIHNDSVRLGLSAAKRQKQDSVIEDIKFLSRPLEPLQDAVDQTSGPTENPAAPPEGSPAGTVFLGRNEKGQARFKRPDGSIFRVEE